MKHYGTFGVLTAFALLLAQSSGCGSSAERTASTDPSDHDGLEHHVPEHKPKTFGDAVHTLHTRLGMIQNSLGSGETAELTVELREFEDIVNWLPELAADSNMRKVQWDEVHEIAKRLQSECARLTELPSTDANPDDTIAACATTIDKLDQFVEFAEDNSADSSKTSKLLNQENSSV